MDRTTSTLVIQLRDLVEHFDSHRVEWALAPDTKATPRDALEAILEYLAADNREGKISPVSEVVKQLTEWDNTVAFRVEYQVDYAPTR